MDMGKFREEISIFLKKQGISRIDLEIPPDPEMGDYAFPCFALSRENREKPNETAKRLADKFRPGKLISKAIVAGPYLNFYVNKQKLAEEVLKDIIRQKENYGSRKKKKERIMVEYSSPNVNKAQHLGHVRNNLLGMALSNILEFSGYDVVRTCVMNDKGMGVAKMMLAYKLWAKGMKPDIKSDHFASRWYVEFGKKAEKDPSLEDKAQEINRLFESGDEVTIKLWKKMTKWVYKGYDETYKRLGCVFDRIYYESELYKHGKDIVLKGLKKGIFEKDDGAVIVNLEKLKLPNKILIKSDNTTLYMTQDIYLAELKFSDFRIDRSIYVVASEQNMHFQQLFAILDMLGYKWAEKCFHLSYGMISLPEGKMKSRQGTVVDADDLMDDMENLAYEEVDKRHELSDKEKSMRAVQIGIGALKFFILKYEPAKDFLYDTKESISFEGETGPYVQYAHARIRSIFRKYGKPINTGIDYSLLSHELEKRLLVLLKQFPEIIEESARSYKPSIPCNYLIRLSQGFNEFYHTCPILKAEPELMMARLVLADCIRQVLDNGLRLLGIEAPEEM